MQITDPNTKLTYSSTDDNKIVKSDEVSEDKKDNSVIPYTDVDSKQIRNYFLLGLNLWTRARSFSGHKTQSYDSRGGSGNRVPPRGLTRLFAKPSDGNGGVDSSENGRDKDPKKPKSNGIRRKNQFKKKNNNGDSSRSNYKVNKSGSTLIAGFGDPNTGSWFGPLESQSGAVSFDSGIPSGLLVNPGQQATLNYSPLYIMCGEFFPNIEKSDKLQTHNLYEELLNEDLYYRYLSDVQFRVNRATESNFPKEKLISYLTSVAHGIQIYYCIDSILVYESFRGNQNHGMTHLRKRISTACLNEHIRLKETLERIVMSPKTVTFLCYMFQNHSYSVSENGPVIRLSFKDMLFEFKDKDKDPLQTGSYQKGIINAINNLSQISSYLSRTYGEWIIKDLPKSTSCAVYDDQFCTFWHNSCITYSDKNAKICYSRFVDSMDTRTYYGILGNKVDGVIYACSTLELIKRTMESYKNGRFIEDIEETISVVYTGLWYPLTKFPDVEKYSLCSLQCMDQDVIRGCTTLPYRVASHLFASPHFTMNNQQTDFTVLENTYNSMKIAQVNSINNMQQAINQSIRFLLYP